MDGLMIRNAVKARGVKLNWLAGAIGISKSAMYDLAAGRAQLSVSRAEQIARALGITIEDFLRYRVSETRTGKKLA